MILNAININSGLLIFMSFGNGNDMRTSAQEVLSNMDLSQNKTLNEIVCESLRATIIQGKIPAGERINELEYAETINISRTPIRYALRVLTQEGLLEYIPNVGVVVKQITPKDAREIYAIRKALDVLATVTAAERMTEEEFGELDKLLTLTEKKNTVGETQEVIKLFTAFNHFIYEKSDMLRLKEVVIKISEYLGRFREISLNSKARCNKAMEEHRLIYCAMLNKDEELIKEIIEEHLDFSFRFILREMEREKVERGKKKTLSMW